MTGKIKVLLSLPSLLWQTAVSYMPGEIGYALRRKFWARRLAYLGGGVKIDVGAYFQNPEFIELHDNCWIDRNVIILAGPDSSNREKIVREIKGYPGKPGVVHIGRNVHVGANGIVSGISAGVYISDDCGFSADCKVFAFSNHYRSKKRPSDARAHFGPLAAHERQCIIEGPVFLGENTGVALNAIILPGVSIPENCFVGIGSVVTGGMFRPNSIISGHPAKETGRRFATGENE